MAFIYHYNATTCNLLGHTYNIDGILTCTGKIDTMDRYHDVKVAIISEKLTVKVEKFNPSDITITSLSFLHEISSD